MNTNVILSKDSNPSDIERYFRGVLELDQQDKVFSVNLDDVWQLAYTRKDVAVRALKANFIENVDYLPLRQNVERSEDGRFSGELLFCAKDVTEALGYSNGRDAIVKHVERGDVAKRDTPIPNQHGALKNQSVTYITESGVHALIFGSKQVVS